MATQMNESNMHQRLLLSKRCPKQVPALFLDRDGVLIEDLHHLADPERVALCDGAELLIQKAKEHQWPVVIVTNQSGISRGYFTWDSYFKVTERILKLLNRDNSISAIYANGYGPEALDSSWRKPNPGMILQAGLDLNLDLKRSILIGDRITDLQAGLNAGVRSLFHVLNGHTAKDEKAVDLFSSDLRTKQTDAKIISLPSLLSFPWKYFTASC
jgi:D-glycero-D-manno-heptose 1,7-bisphosphate phosphatase